ncbi:uncharacterized protein LMH87_007690 [Akanthomyces muscarius]|uniref:NWD NACHT-NTPase N-terminal domain-containing protein n=1 Tax=Akanthomyces muscarius TaxID=2231603 RepID=A0A9W8URD5_AKAMU|nr:uncharacterized protein LMH87_007690 [Akanthomyces muscarius]KAJ4161664.1 hypothetical protein LMH87_007690 [Akanthomyces muscarius]
MDKLKKSYNKLNSAFTRNDRNCEDKPGILKTKHGQHMRSLTSVQSIQASAIKLGPLPRLEAAEHASSKMSPTKHSQEPSKASQANEGSEASSTQQLTSLEHRVWDEACDLTLNEPNFWVEAYDGLKADYEHGKLVLAYEEVLKVRYAPNFSKPGRTDDNCGINLDIRKAIMKQIVRNTMESVVEYRQKSNGTEESIVDYCDPFLEYWPIGFNDISTVVLPLAVFISALELLVRSPKLKNSIASGIKEVSKRLKWYLSLSNRIMYRLGPVDQEKDRSDPVMELKERILSLYKAVLMYQMKSVCLNYHFEGWEFLDDSISLSDWEGDFSDIIEAEIEVLHDIFFRELEYQGASRQTLEGHIRSVNATALSRDGKRLASASGDNTIRLWDVAKGTAQRTLKGHTDWVTALAFSRNGKKLASASGDNTIRLWDAANDTAPRTLKGHTDWVTAIAFSRHSEKLASASVDNTVRFWDAVTGTAQQTLGGHTGWVTAIAFSPNGKTLASASGDKTIRLWNAVTGTAQQTLKGHTGWVTAVVFSPNSKILASASVDKTVRLWNAVRGTAHHTPMRHFDQVTSIAFSHNSKTLASASVDNTVRLWDAVKGTIKRRLEGHTKRVTSIVFSRNSKTLASASFDNTIQLWNSSRGMTRH